MAATINRKDVTDKLDAIFKSRLDCSILDGDYQLQEPLLGSRAGLDPSQLLYIFFDIEREFNISIPEEDIADGAFANFDGIVEIICRQLKAQKESV